MASKILDHVDSPVTELWSSKGRMALKAVRELGRNDIAELLRHGVNRFVLAGSSWDDEAGSILAPGGVNHGWRLKWIGPNECFAFWKNEAKLRLVEPETKAFRLEDFPDCYCYSATEWSGTDGTVIFLLRHH